MYSVKDVAKWFLHEESMTHKKLQKLCYYAQAWHCALHRGDPLFSEQVEAWVHGPVIPALYASYACYGWDRIPKVEEPVNFDEEAEEVLASVYETYHEYSSDQLERLTHSECPWKEARGDLRPFEPSHNIITTEAMRAYYWRVYEQAQGV